MHLGGSYSLCIVNERLGKINDQLFAIKLTLNTNIINYLLFKSHRKALVGIKIHNALLTHVE